MKTFKRTILSIAALTALSCIGAASLCAKKNPSVVANADVSNVELLSPESYVQYLPLVAPTDIAVTENFTAIADGQKIYVYEGNITGNVQGEYRIYTHKEAVSELSFDDNNNLYFLSEFELYKLPLNALGTPMSATKVESIVCSGFTIKENTLYYYAMSKNVIKRYSLTNGAPLEDITLTAPLQEYTPLTIDKDGILYYASDRDSAYTIYAVNVTTRTSNAVITFNEPLKSITIANHLLGVVTKSGIFYTYSNYDLDDSKAENITPITDTSLDETDKNGYMAVYPYEDSIFAIRDNAIRQYSVSKLTFTDFEITSASAAPHRFNSANDVFLAENKLFIADDGNDRISVYNTETQVFETAIPSALPDPYLAAYKDTLLVASTQEATLYNLSAEQYGKSLLNISIEEADCKIIGVACVYDRYYLVTNNNYTYTFTATDNVWNYKKVKNTSKVGVFATAFTADIFGSLYVTYNSGELYRFTEKELTSSSSTGTKIFSGLNNVEKISVDYKANIYALSNGIITKYIPNDPKTEEDNEIQPFTLHYNLVKDDTPLLTSFTFGVEEQTAYLLYEGNYVISSKDLQIDTVETFDIDTAIQTIFDGSNQSFSLVKVLPEQKDEFAILTEFDLNLLQNEPEKFSYIAFDRCDASFTALKLGEEKDYSVLAVGDGNIGYKTYLVKTKFCETISPEGYHIPYAESNKTGYLTSAASLYKFPYLNTALTVAEMPRGAKVTLLGEIHQLDRTYYEISYTNENGEVKTGYIPTSYINLFDGTAPKAETITYGETEDDTESVGRMLYILLGLGAIGILIDVLLLKKSKETDEN
ncbi:MAG: hypothetical protein IKA57_04465 [Clostridia bacterium]|nr:hypothetical protein [Clostridia bacterium]